MKIIYVVVACALTLIVSAAPVQAKLLDNSWYPFEFVLEADPNCPTEDTAFLVQGMQHVKVSTLRKGGVAIHFNALGTITGIQSGQEAHWRHNVSDVLPIDGENSVYTHQETLKLIGQGGNPSYFAKTKIHITVLGGEVKSYIDVEEISCPKADSDG